MLLGTQYYRPPNPRPEDWERDLALIKEYGLDLVRMWLYWSWVNPQEGVWRWDDYDRLMELAAKKGLKVLVQLMCDGTPYWFEQKYPETRYVDADGRPVEFHAKASQSIGGAPGPCFHHPRARAAAEEFMRRAAERYRDADPLYAYDLWNEIWMHECFCEHTQAEFRRFLKEKYGDIQNLNAVWGRSYTSFDEVFLPKAGVYADMIDRYEFEQWSREQLLLWRYRRVRAVDRKHPLVSHYGGHCSLLAPEHDPWLFADAVDIWGTSCYDTTLAEAALTFHATACAAGGKPWWLSEHSGGRTWHYVGEKNRSPEFLRSFNVLALSFGAEANIYWQWRPEIFGQEAPHFGLTSLSGEPTPRTRLVKEFAEMLRRHKALFDSMELVPPEVGIIWEPRAIAYERINRGERRSGTWLFWENFAGWHRALMEIGFPTDILNARLLASKGIPEGIRLIIAPMQVFDRRALTSALEDWVKKGGTLIAGPWYGMFDENTYVNQQVPPTELFGARQTEVYYPERPQVELAPIGPPLGHLPATGMIEALELQDAEVLGVFGEWVVIVRRKVGKGQVFYIGTFLGNLYDHVDRPQLACFLKWIGGQSGICARAEATGGCFVRTATTKAGRLIFITNPYTHPVTTWLTIQGSGTLIDLFSEQQVGEVREGRPIPLHLAPEDSRILKLTIDRKSELKQGG